MGCIDPKPARMWMDRTTFHHKDDLFSGYFRCLHNQLLTDIGILRRRNQEDIDFKKLPFKLQPNENHQGKHIKRCMCYRPFTRAGTSISSQVSTSTQRGTNLIRKANKKTPFVDQHKALAHQINKGFATIESFYIAISKTDRPLFYCYQENQRRTVKPTSSILPIKRLAIVNHSMFVIQTSCGR